jgi:Spx/MgsR family transcriptional regulator
MTVRLYGLSNCDQVRKARKWLEAEHIDFDFIDFRKAAFQPQAIQQWLTQTERDAIINPASKGWKTLSEPEQSVFMVQSDSDFCVALHQQPTLIKRPVLETEKGLVFRFKPEAYADVL